MRVEKHIESLKEVIDEIENALKDAKGITKHQRRLAIMLSIGACELIEIYFHKLNIMKSSSRIKHTWFKQSRIKEALSNQIVCNLSEVRNIDKIISIAKSIEDKRDDMAYGAPVKEDNLLKNKITEFLELKKLIETEIGEILEPE